MKDRTERVIRRAKRCDCPPVFTFIAFSLFQTDLPARAREIRSELRLREWAKHGYANRDASTLPVIHISILFVLGMDINPGTCARIALDGAVSFVENAGKSREHR
eukprot:SAG11_NODE_485_length_9035_cov_16.221352_11_plen_105_part_00